MLSCSREKETGVLLLLNFLYSSEVEPDILIIRCHFYIAIQFLHMTASI